MLGFLLRGRNRRRLPIGAAIAFGLIKLAVVIGVIGGTHTLGEDHKIKGFASELRSQPGITSVTELSGSQVPAGKDKAYAVNGNVVTLTFDKSFGKLVVGDALGPGFTTAQVGQVTTIEAAIEHVASDKGFH